MPLLIESVSMTFLFQDWSFGFWVRGPGRLVIHAGTIGLLSELLGHQIIFAFLAKYIASSELDGVAMVSDVALRRPFACQKL